MARDDGILNTGASSASFGSTKEQQIQADKRKEQSDVKAEKRIKLQKHSEIVLEEIQKDIDELSDIKFAHVSDLLKSGIPNALEIDMLSNEKTIQRLTGLKNRLDNILRTPDAVKKPVTSENPDAGEL